MSRSGGPRHGAVVIAAVAAAAVVAIGGVAAAVTLTGKDHRASPASLSAGVRVAPSFQAVADVTPPVAASKCTAATTFSYTGTISATAPGTVKFQWVYSSGKPGPVQTMSFTSAGHKAVAGARVTTAKAGGGWGEIKLLSPAAQASDKAAYKLLCSSGSSIGGVTASATVTPAHRTASCVTAPPSFTVTGSIRAAKAEKVTYYWAQSHGKDSAPASLTFTAPGIMPARPLTIIPPGASGSGSAVLVVTSPVTTASSPAAYTLTCTPPPTSSTPATSPTSPTGPTSPTSPSSSTTAQPTTTQPTVSATAPQGLSATASVSPASQTDEQCGLFDAVTFSGTITDDQAGTVSYYWDMPGGPMPEPDLHFAAAGTLPVATLSIGGPSANNISEAGRIVITSPRTVTSNDAIFTVTCAAAVPPNDRLEVDPGSLTPDDLVGQPYTGEIRVSGGRGPYTWSDVTGLPPGLTVTAYDGVLVITGTPTQGGHFNGSVLITDSSSPPLTTTADIPIFVAAQRLSGVAPSSVTCKVGQPCSFTVTAVGGDGNYKWIFLDGNRPDWLSETSNGATLTVSGTPVTPGQYMTGSTIVDGESLGEFWVQTTWAVTVTVNPLPR